MSNPNKSRGNRLERVVAKTLSSVLKAEFVRTPGSGSWGRAKTKGDVVCIDSNVDFPFCIECKKTDKVQLDLLLRQPMWSDFVKWWKQTCTQAVIDHKKPMLIMSHNQGVLVTVITRNAWDETTYKNTVDGFTFMHKDVELVITELTTYLELLPDESFREVN